VGVIAEGRIVSTLQQHGLYSLVEDQAGRTGWLEKDKIASIDGIATGLKDHQDKKGSAQ
jgi:hypothetical protein